MKRVKRTGEKNGLFILLNVILSVIWLLPIYWAFVTSVKTNREIYSGITLFPRNFTAANYHTLFSYKDGLVLEWLRNSFFVCVITMLAVTAIAVLAGFAFSKLELPCKFLWLSMISFTLMVPVTALLVPLYNTMSQIGLLGTLWSSILIYITFQTPFCTLMMKRSFDMVPKELREAALVDGASSFQIFRRIYVPLALPGTITVLVYSAYHTWNDYTVALTFGGGSLKTFNIGLVDLLTASTDMMDWGMLTSGSVVGMLPILVLFLFLQKYFVKGMMSGAVK
ncbi:MAG: carbohydrate ABC transporter permease [Clostridia bacterium]|nr:carbohydrate ABC transporter permease [Clostridia bacterium]